ncbi:MAG TPA: hypothetical protein ENH35_02825 [Candidatus Moranbacteria bacterium]|nr:hypothetical protein [Candidatus Moranbacteria bacterium]
MMKNKIKKIAYTVSSGLLLAPVVVLAQYAAPDNTNLPGGTVFNIISNLMKWLLALVGVIGVIGFAIAGILYLTAAGNEDRVSQAKKAMIMSIIGVIVALVGLVILQAVNAWLGGGETTF